MANREIDENEYETLVRAKTLLNDMWNDGDNGMAFKKMVKAKYKDAKIPEIDIVEQAKKPLEEKLSKTEETLKALEKRLNDKDDAEKQSKEERELEKDLETARKKFSLTDDGFEKVIKRMKEKNSLDAEAAAAWVASSEPKAKPATESKLGLPNKANLFGSARKDDEWKSLNENPMDWFDGQVEDVINNPEKYREFGGQL
jgi:hypothetical protein